MAHLADAIRKQAAVPKPLRDLATKAGGMATEAAQGYRVGRKGLDVTNLAELPKAKQIGHRAGQLSTAGDNLSKPLKAAAVGGAALPGAAIMAARGSTAGEDKPRYTADQLEAPIGGTPRSSTLNELIKLMRSNTGKASAAGAVAGGLGGYALGERMGMGATGAVAGTALGGLLAALAERQVSKTAAALYADPSMVSAALLAMHLKG